MKGHEDELIGPAGGAREGEKTEPLHSTGAPSCDRCTKADRLLRQALLILDRFSNNEIDAKCGAGSAASYRLGTQVFLGERDEVEL